jgi:hypothetical protein
VGTGGARVAELTSGCIRASASGEPCPAAGFGERCLSARQLTAPTPSRITGSSMVVRMAST